MTEDETDCCPLCMEELDLTDKTFDACRCGYQVPFIVRNTHPRDLMIRSRSVCGVGIKLRTNTMVFVQHVGHHIQNWRNPKAMSTVKSKLNYVLYVTGCPLLYALVSVVRKTKQRKQKEKNEKKTTTSTKVQPVNRKNLANVRVMQRNLVYVIGLPVHFADDDVRSDSYFVCAVNISILMKWHV